jgi:hypothetical protein
MVQKTGGSRFLLASLVVVPVVAGVLARQVTSAQSLSYSSGQSVYPAYEGWEKNADGSSSFLFGYMNENWEEEIDVPIGPDNNIEPGGPDLGQPTHLQPRRNRFMFRVHVPKDFGQKEMVWTLTTHGKTVKAYGTLRTDYLLENIDLMSETGALGAGISSPEIRADQAPVVTIEGQKTRSVKVGQPLRLVAAVTDDGVPRGRGAAPAGQAGGRAAPPPPAPVEGRGADQAASAPALSRGTGRNPALNPPAQITVGKRLGLHASWFVYRGAGKVTFDPVQVKTWEDTRAGANSPWAPLWIAPPAPPDGKYAVQAIFDVPGTYGLRCRADDGALAADDELTVTVTR